MLDLLQDLNDFGFQDLATVTKTSAIQAAIRKIEQAQPWPFLEASIDLTFDGTNPTPTNFPTSTFRATIRLKDRTTGGRVRYVREEDFEDYVGLSDLDAGDPVFYYFDAHQLKVWRVPPVGRIVRMKYLQNSNPTLTDSSPDSDIAVPAKYRRVILYGALVDLNDLDDDPDIAVRNEAKFNQGMAMMLEDAFKRQYDSPEIIVPTDPDDWDYGTYF